MSNDSIRIKLPKDSWSISDAIDNGSLTTADITEMLEDIDHLCNSKI